MAAKYRVEVHLRETAQPIVHDAENAYTKGPFFCVYDGTNVYKYPVEHIWRVTEEYRP